MKTLAGIIFFACGLAASIALHELGHFIPAKKFGVKVTQYMIGFGPTLWSRRKGETEYGFKAIPLGGYIRMIGMFAPLSAVAKPRAGGRFSLMIQDARDEAQSEITEADEGRTFHSLSVPKKLTVMFGGPVTNLLIATVLFGALFIGHGTQQANTTVDYVFPCVPTTTNSLGLLNESDQCDETESTPAALAGLKSGDRIVAINGESIKEWSEIGVRVSASVNKPITVSVERAGSSSPIDIQLTPIPAKAMDGQPIEGRSFIGIWPQMPLVKMSPTKLPAEIFSMTKDAAVSIVQFPISVAKLAVNLFSSEERDPNGPVSVVGVGQISGDIANSADLTIKEKFVNLTSVLASLNLFLFVFNMVPLLPLDGGHIAGAIFEGLRRFRNRVTGRGFAGPSDTARLLPLTYVVSIGLLLLGGIVIIADLIKPLNVLG